MCLEEDHRSKVSFSSHHIKGAYDQHDVPADVDLDHLADVGSVRFLRCQAIYLFKEWLYLFFKHSFKKS